MFIKAGFRKGNEPPGTWSYFCVGQLYVCACRVKFVETNNDGGSRLVRIEGMEDYDMAARN